MSRQLICRVKLSSTLAVFGLFALAGGAIATMPLWSHRAFYPWDRLDVSWLIGASACAAIIFWLLPRHLLRLRASGGWGVWTDGESLFLVSRAEPMPLKDIGRVEIYNMFVPTVLIRLAGGATVQIAAWGMDISEQKLMEAIETARRELQQRRQTPLS